MYCFPEDLRKAYESSPLSFVYYQKIGGKAVPVLASEGFVKNTGMPRERVLEWLGAGLFERMHPDDVGVVSRISDDFLNRRGPYDVAFRCRIGNRYELIHGFGKWQTMPDGTELAVIGYVNMAQTREIMLSFVQGYAIFQKDRFYTDPLTELPNINYLHEFAGERANVIRGDGKTPAVIYVDVASMQSYNNQYGFGEGDRLLCQVASALKTQFPDDLVVRGADDHFIIVASVRGGGEELPGKLAAARERIRREASGNTSGIRSGICLLGREDTVTEGMDRARHALKRLENDLNRSFLFFSREADDQYWKQRYIIENFERAMEEGWIKAYYQGIVRVETEKTTAFEALTRWIDPARGTISPGEFIPVLQRYHQLYKLDLYMLEQICREIPIRHENGLPLLPVSVNFCCQDFDHTDVVGAMNALYEKYDLQKYVDRDYFIVEITEHDIALGTKQFREQLKGIRENGYQLWLDDFGSGYSAINTFSQFNFDLVKYDMELLRRLDENGGANRVILKELLEMARKLGIHTLIEGLENEEQLAFLREIGCELAQGFYYYQPESLESQLYRLRGGQKLRPSETPEERREYRRRRFREGQNNS